MSLIKLKIVYEIGATWDWHCYHCIETILLIFSGKQWRGFHVMVTLA